MTSMRMTQRPEQIFLTLLVAAGLATTAGCDDEKTTAPVAPTTPAADVELKHGLTPEQAAQTLVTVGDKAITLGDFADRLGSQSPYLRARYTSPERRREFLDNMVRFELLAIEASKKGLDKSPTVVRVRKQMMVQRRMTELFEEKGVKLADISDDEINAYYTAHQGEFTKPAQMRASHIVVKKRALADRLLAERKAKPGDMQLFRKLAKEHNIDPETKDRLGDLRFFPKRASGDPSETTMPPAVRAAAFTLEKTGALYANVVETPKGLHIIKLTGKRDKLDRTLEDARRLIQNRLWREKREAAIEGFVSSLRDKAEIKEFPELLAQVRVKQDAAGDKPGAAAAKTGSKTTESKKAAPKTAGK